MLIVAGWLRVDPDRRGDYLDGCRVVVEHARRAPGCVDFALTADPVEHDRINVFEQWESDKALERFRGSGPEPAQAAELRDAHVRKYRIASVEPP